MYQGDCTLFTFFRRPLAQAEDPDPPGSVLLQHPAVLFPHFVPLPAQSLRFPDRCFFELYLLTGAELGEQRNVGADDRGDLGITAGRLPVRHHHDRLAVAGDLDAPVHNAVRENVVTVRRLDLGTFQPVAHPVAERGDLICAPVECAQSLLREHLLLGSRDHTHFRYFMVIRGDQLSGRHPAPRHVFFAVPRVAQADRIACLQRSSLKSSDPTAEVRASAPHDDGNIQASAHGNRAVDAGLPRLDLYCRSGRHTHGLVRRKCHPVKYDLEITTAHGNIHCFVKLQRRPHQAEFQNGFGRLIPDQ